MSSDSQFQPPFRYLLSAAFLTSGTSVTTLAKTRFLVTSPVDAISTSYHNHTCPPPTTLTLSLAPIHLPTPYPTRSSGHIPIVMRQTFPTQNKKSGGANRSKNNTTGTGTGSDPVQYFIKTGKNKTAPVQKVAGDNYFDPDDFDPEFDEEGQYDPLCTDEHNDDEAFVQESFDDDTDNWVNATTNQHHQLHDAVPTLKAKKKTKKLPVVAIIGRPNVGKSQLVNRLAETFRTGSIVEDVVGITRDRTYRRAFWGQHNFRIVDTGGIVFEDKEGEVFMKEIRMQANLAIKEATVVILVVDGMAGWNPLDQDIAHYLKTEFPGLRDIVVCVNKCDNSHSVLNAAEFWKLGCGEPMAISAMHGSGTGELLDRVVSNLPVVTEFEDEEEGAIQVAIIGKPNVGKSSLLNKIVRKERSIVSDIAGTTRDAVDELYTAPNGNKYNLIDTAGIRRKNKVDFGTEFFMINRAFRAIRRADCVCLVIDAQHGVTDQDRKLAERIKDEGRACVVLLNKWDLVEAKDNHVYNSSINFIREMLPIISWANVNIVSAVSGQRVTKIINSVDAAVHQHRRRISTAILNEILQDAVQWHKPPTTDTARQGKIYYCTQVGVRPPTIAMFVNDPSLFKDNYRRYMEKRFRENLGFDGTPIRILYRGRSRGPTDQYERSKLPLTK